MEGRTGGGIGKEGLGGEGKKEGEQKWKSKNGKGVISWQTGKRGPHEGKRKGGRDRMRKNMMDRRLMKRTPECCYDAPGRGRGRRTAESRLKGWIYKVQERVYRG